MTKEEMAKAYAEGYEDENYGQIAYDAFLCGFTAKCESSLPSNLDEAAEKYAWRKEEPLSDGERLSFCFNPRIDAFKTGAKWMAEQGSSFKVNVEEVPQGHWYAGLHLGGCAEEEENALKSINAKDGEEVIVQIRKKEE